MSKRFLSASAICRFLGKDYSLILMLDVLEHLEDPVGALQHAVDLLTPEGTLLITVPAFMALWTNHDVLNHHLTRYTKRSFSNVARGQDSASRKHATSTTGPFRQS